MFTVASSSWRQTMSTKLKQLGHPQRWRSFVGPTMYKCMHELPWVVRMCLQPSASSNPRGLLCLCCRWQWLSASRSLAANNRCFPERRRGGRLGCSVLRQRSCFYTTAHKKATWRDTVYWNKDMKERHWWADGIGMAKKWRRQTKEPKRE